MRTKRLAGWLADLLASQPGPRAEARLAREPALVHLNCELANSLSQRRRYLQPR